MLSCGQYDRLSGRCQADLARLRAYFSRLYSVIYNDESQDCFYQRLPSRQQLL